MHRKLLMTISLGVMAFALGFFPTLAQSGDSVYLYNGMTKQLLRLNLDGAQISYSLGLDENTFVGGFDMAFNGDGSRVAFCTLTYPQIAEGDAPAQPTAHLYVRDLAAGVNLIDRDMGSAIGCRTGHEAFNQAGTLLAVSRINYYPNDPAADTSQPTWQLLVVDTTSGAVVNALNATSAAVANYESLAKGGILPYVQSFNGNTIIFAEVPYGIGGGAEWNAYQWQTDAEILTPVERWGNFTLEVLPSTGETLWVTRDPNLPAGEPGGPVPANNIVQIEDTSGAVKTIYHSPDWVILDATFINGGQAVAIELLSSFDPATQADGQPIQQTLKWIGLDRSGAITDLATSNGNPTVAAAPGGYVTLNQQILDPNTGISQFDLSYTANGGGTTLWTSPAGENGYWELAWITPISGDAGLQPFAAVSG